ncbi:MAG: polysaccharide biosynthesis tyrosine autokinase [Planctomycetota bacterium]|jgi:uncharacterized protein involved in exopolysaccharide biosynthesis
MMDNNKIENGASNSMLSEQDGSLQESMLLIALRHRWTILLTTALFLVAAFIYLLKATPFYESESRLYVEQQGPRIINEFEGVMAQSGNYLYTQGELLMSTSVLGNVVDDPNVARLRTFADVDNLMVFIRANLDVSVGRKDDIITVSFESPYPVEAAQIVNSVVASYKEYHSSTKRDTASEVLKILQKEKLERDKELSDKFEEMLQFTKDNGVVSFDNKGGNIVFERLATLSSALTEAELSTLAAKADFEAVKSMLNEPAKIRQFAAASARTGIEVSLADRETQLQAELRQAEMELKNVRYHCTEEHPSVKALEAKISLIELELEKQAKEFADAYVEVMELRWVTAREREDELNVSFGEQHLAARNLGVKAAEYSVLQSELSRAERICAILDDRIKELNVTEDVGALNINILGSGLALLRDWLDFRLRSSEEVSAVLGIPVLGVVPRMLTKKALAVPGHKTLATLRPIVAIDDQKVEAAPSSVEAQSESLVAQGPDEAATEEHIAAERSRKIPAALESVRWVQRMSRKTDRLAPVTPSDAGVRRKPKTRVAPSRVARGPGTSAEKADIVTRGQKVHLDSKSVVAEAYRTIRTAVFFGAPKDAARTILVTSPAPGDGKSTLASNLAITMAQAGQKTLLMDADFRKPVQHRIFEVDDSRGLSAVLAGRDTKSLKWMTVTDYPPCSREGILLSKRSSPALSKGLRS